MGERDVAAEVLDGLHEIREHRAGRRTLRATRVEAKPLAELAPGMMESGSMGFQEPASGSRRPLQDVGRKETSCARCGADAVDTVEQRHTFRYGSGEAAADLTVDLPVRRCAACGFEFLDRDSEAIKLERIPR